MEGRRALFPDCPTARGTRHVNELIAARRRGHQAALHLRGASRGRGPLSPWSEMDPHFARALRDARAARRPPVGLHLPGHPRRMHAHPPDSRGAGLSALGTVAVALALAGTSYRTGDPAIDGLQPMVAQTLSANRKTFTGKNGTVQGFGAGTTYPQIWIRDSATLLPAHAVALRPRAPRVVARGAPRASERRRLAQRLGGGGGGRALQGTTRRARGRCIARGPSCCPRTATPPRRTRNRARCWPRASPLTRPATRSGCASPSPAARSWTASTPPCPSSAARQMSGGLVTAAFTADWGDVSPVYGDQRVIYRDEATPVVAGLYASALYARAARDLAGPPSRRRRARDRRGGRRGRSRAAAINRRLWQPRRGFYRLHLPVVSPPGCTPPDDATSSPSAATRWPRSTASPADAARARLMDVAESAAASTACPRSAACSSPRIRPASSSIRSSAAVRYQTAGSGTGGRAASCSPSSSAATRRGGGAPARCPRRAVAAGGTTGHPRRAGRGAVGTRAARRRSGPRARGPVRPGSRHRRPRPPRPPRRAFGEVRGGAGRRTTVAYRQTGDAQGTPSRIAFESTASAPAGSVRFCSRAGRRRSPSASTGRAHATHGADGGRGGTRLSRTGSGTPVDAGAAVRSAASRWRWPRSPRRGRAALSGPASASRCA